MRNQFDLQSSIQSNTVSEITKSRNHSHIGHIDGLLVHELLDASLEVADLLLLQNVDGATGRTRPHIQRPTRVQEGIHIAATLERGQRLIWD